MKLQELSCVTVLPLDRDTRSEVGVLDGLEQLQVVAEESFRDDGEPPTLLISLDT